MLATIVNADHSLSAAPAKADRGVAFAPAQPTMATPAAVAFAAASVAAFVGAFNVSAAVG